uniref:Uncharacterized protein n=1 Tax=Arundo donax TaxID=35708 RepID=A0A0A9B9R3_ARUDO
MRSCFGDCLPTVRRNAQRNETASRVHLLICLTTPWTVKSNSSPRIKKPHFGDLDRWALWGTGAPSC